MNIVKGLANGTAFAAVINVGQHSSKLKAEALEPWNRRVASSCSERPDQGSLFSRLPGTKAVWLSMKGPFFFFAMEPEPLKPFAFLHLKSWVTASGLQGQH